MNIGSPLRILLVEDDELFRLGLLTRLQREPLLHLVDEATDGESALELINQKPFDIVLLDVGLPGIGGVETCRKIRREHPNLPVLILTSHSQQPLIEQLVSVGASGFCLKGIEAETLILALRSVAAGASWWDACSTQQIRTAFLAKPMPPAKVNQLTTPLTQREQEILALLAVGKSNPEISKELCITTGTVRVHVHAILRKLEVRDRTQAALFAIQNTLVPDAKSTETKKDH
ncbi:response regulator transcription factor [Leptothoe sp. PORK10 BA2]|uniref:response regulator transcription factor n=1 Tax=Leptothoe sp. PORK10 BA2 TaxID=3110254 RepID=UPI002B21CC3D|nr:response regulator transcription factor [Leptothoe sp. PORK10 BA2]MEA5464892.1 response regulator transcription factor [Leptothoe sp. PORK10 BA2]